MKATVALVNRSDRRRVAAALAALLIFGLALAPRLVRLDAVVTPDEMRWVCRSINFRNALLARDWAHTFQSGHPGVMTMWLGSAAATASGVAPDSSLSASCYTARVMDFQPRAELYQMRDMLVLARRLMAVVLSLAVVAITWLAARLFGRRAALLAAVLLAFDPFLLAHSRILHLDALTTSLVAPALLLLLLYVRGLPAVAGGRQNAGTPALLSVGVLSGLAMINKSPALFMAPFVAGVLAIAYVRRSGLSRDTAIHYLRDGLLVAGGALIAGVALWPALWVDPAGTVGRSLGQAADYAETGAQWSSYFLGETGSDPGVLFYPVAILFRTTPVVWLGVLAAVVVLARRAGPWARPESRSARLWRPRDPSEVDRVSLVALFAFALTFVAFMTLGAKKGERYVLEIFPALDVAAAVGLAWLAARIPRLNEGISSRLSAGLAAGLVLVLGQGFYSLLYLPDFLSYYNPVMGGSATAQNILKIGWGEGLDRAAAYLNAQPDASNLRAATWYIDSFAPLFRGYSSQLSEVWGDLSEVDYLLLYVNDIQRGINQPAIRRFYGPQTPQHVVRMHGIDYVYIYRNPWREPKVPQHALRVEMGDGVRLLGYDLDAADVRPGAMIDVTLYWQCERRTPASYTVFTHLLAADGALLGQHDGLPHEGKLPTSRWFPGQVVVDSHPVPVGGVPATGPYALAVGMYDFQSLQRLPAYDPAGARLPDDRVLIPLAP